MDGAGGRDGDREKEREGGRGEMEGGRWREGGSDGLKERPPFHHHAGERSRDI